MSWFEEQIEYRKKREQELLSDSFQGLARSVTGHKIGSGWIEDGRDVQDALSQLLKYYHIREKEIPEKLTDLEDKLDYVLSSTGILYREVKLDKGWSRNALGVLISVLKESDHVITLIPGQSGKYIYIDPMTGRRVKVSRSEENKISERAICFYRPLPMRKLSLYDLGGFMLESLSTWDFASLGIVTLIITLVGMLMPRLNKILMGDVVAYGSHALLGAVILFMFSVTVSSTLFSVSRSLLLARIRTKLEVNVNAASMMRVLSLPAGFFKDYSAGELNEYIRYMNGLCGTLVDSVLSTGLTGVFSLVYLVQIFTFAKSLVIPSMIITIMTLSISMFIASINNTIGKERMKIAAQEKGLIFALINGMQKIRLSGAENRAFVKWANLYSQESALLYDTPFLVRFQSVITSSISMIGTVIMYGIAIKSQVSVADYYAFNASYAYISTAFTALASLAMTAATIKPSLELIKPLMEAEPELKEGLSTITQLSGRIELSHVSFKYNQEGPLILDDISINIPARQYVAIVGKTGCGKSTLMRLLLGFESPTQGSIFFDKKDMKRLDMASVRKKIGTVMQDGRLFSGSIFENITISAPLLTLDEAWEAAEIAGIADDIRNMPMGMHTQISEGAGGISGGQRQRLMIARAVAPKPKVLLLDEATSALDNITQKKVSDALDKMRCTRIVIAHRLSTIRHCDRILVLDGGKIVEDGTYDELIAKKGFFAELVERQRVDL